ncbi:hypothetical protein IU448_22695 [Nocardia flavorosea]|uniref:hypothetical protein n=1 Tax=Nocardia flavorosea TaxID=53429 RepID=UPI0018946ED9|nr:hypothetical protein [Nocardia flavorosea]MBF6351801.1 hypothetical protein [Nocardia flavorosea]
MTIAIHPSVDTDWAHWHRRYSTRLHSAHRELVPLAQHSLGESPAQLPGVPGTWWVVDGRVFVAAKPGDRLDHNGARIAGIEILDPANGTPGLLLRHDNHAIEVLRQGERTTIRVHAPID